MLLAVLPLLALQIQAVADMVYIMTLESSPEHLAFGFCIIIMLFAMAFGTRHIASREKHHGLVFAIAVESMIKLTAMLIIGGVILFQVFDGPSSAEEITGSPSWRYLDGED
jgi:Na+/proline symporter